MGGKKIGLSLIVFLVATAIYVCGLVFEWNGKGMDADQWIGLTWKILLFACGSNVVAMGIHAFATNNVSSAEKLKDEG